MIIELKGVEFINKGAYLMLLTIIEKVREVRKDAIFAMGIGARTPFRKLRAHGIHAKLNGRRYSRLAKWIPRPIRRKLGFVLDKEIEVILDGSGFAFGDQWGAAYAQRRLGSKVSGWKRQGKKLILLPQAFGPFSEPELKKVMANILDHSDLVFAREEQSYGYLKELSCRADFRLAPDFTVLIKGRIPADFDSSIYRVPIIPNYKMTGEGRGKVYQRFLLSAIRNVLKTGLTPYFLIHEGAPDMEIARQVNAELETPLVVITNEDPLQIKGIISSAYFVVCSRFHGAVSALSQGVPCLVTGWSHKYGMLLKDYDYPEGLISDLEDEDGVRNLIFKLADPNENGNIARKLYRFSAIQRERSASMWKMVFDTINK